MIGSPVRLQIVLVGLLCRCPDCFTRNCFLVSFCFIYEDYCNWIQPGYWGVDVTCLFIIPSGDTQIVSVSSVPHAPHIEVQSRTVSTVHLSLGFPVVVVVVAVVVAVDDDVVVVVVGRLVLVVVLVAKLLSTLFVFDVVAVVSALPRKLVVLPSEVVLSCLLFMLEALLVWEVKLEVVDFESLDAVVLEEVAVVVVKAGAVSWRVVLVLDQTGVEVVVGEAMVVGKARKRAVQEDKFLSLLQSF